MPIKVAAIVLLFSLLSGCEENRQPGQPFVPLPGPLNVDPKLAANFEKAATNIQNIGQFAKSRIRRNANGETLYGNAQEAHNACVRYVQAGLITGMNQQELRQYLVNADNARVALEDWCNQNAPRDRTPRPRRNNEKEVTAAPAIIGIGLEFMANMFLGIWKLEQERQQHEVEIWRKNVENMQRQLDGCKSRSWSEL